MKFADTAFVNGIYSVSEASRLVGVSNARIRRAIWGYRVSGPIFRGDYRGTKGLRSLSFLDLTEVRILDLLRKERIGWKRLRRAVERASIILGRAHPFSTNRIRLFGDTIFIQLDRPDGESELVDVLTAQMAIQPVLEPFLRDLEYGEDWSAARWWPMGRRFPVLVDPLVCRGRPVVRERGVPTTILVDCFEATGSLEAVGDWYFVKREEIEAALEFERKLGRAIAA